MRELNLDRRVVCAAIRAENGDVIVGIRHYSTDMHYQIRNRPDGRRFENRHDDDQGFVNTWGEYLTREEAYVVAKHNGQIFRETSFTGQGKLDSEALY
jgi:hypothetical protein